MVSQQSIADLPRRLAWILSLPLPPVVHVHRQANTAEFVHTGSSYHRKYKYELFLRTAGLFKPLR